MTRNITAPSSFLLSPTQPPPPPPSHVKEVSCKNRNFSFSHYPAKLCHRMSSRYGRYLSRHQSGIKISHINFQYNEGVSMGCLYLVQLHQPQSDSLSSQVLQHFQLIFYVKSREKLWVSRSEICLLLLCAAAPVLWCIDFISNIFLNL